MALSSPIASSAEAPFAAIEFRITVRSEPAILLRLRERSARRICTSCQLLLGHHHTAPLQQRPQPDLIRVGSVFWDDVKRRRCLIPPIHGLSILVIVLASS